MKNKLLTALLLISTAAALAGCQRDDGRRNDGNRYEYQGQGCTTGSQTYTTMAEYCQRLADESRNGYCATGRRYENFRQSCGGYDWNRGGYGPQAPTPYGYYR